MLSRRELSGILISVVVMAVALFVIRSQTTWLLIANNDSSNEVVATGTVQVDTSSGTDSGSLRSALMSAMSNSGVVKELVINDVVIGDGATAAVGDTVVVNYVGTLQNGQEFDNSYTRGTPFTFTLGEKKVIAGWEEGVVGMKEGGKRILIIPADKGYGSNGFGPIPGGATLLFSVELLDVK